MSWLAAVLVVGGLIALFASWDLIFCHGTRCGENMDLTGGPRPDDRF
jgi:hypothetical protein